MPSIPEFPAHARPRSRPVRALPAVLAFALAFAACADEPTRPTTGGAEQEEAGHTPPHALGLVEITISGLGTGQVTSSALSAPTVEALERLRAQRAAGGAAPGGLAPEAFTLPDDSAGGRDGTIQLELLSTGSFTDGQRGAGGYRYLYATYRVRNAPAGDSTGYNTERKNLTFYAVDTDGTIGVTAISGLQLFNGSPADAALASAFVPTGAAGQDARGGVVPRFPDVFQVVTETEADAIQALADSAGVADVFPYGFVVSNPSDPMSRTLGASPAAGQFDGVVTFAFKVPLQASPAEDPFTVSALFLAVDDDEVKLTQSVEEQTPAGRLAFDARADALGAEVLTLLPPAGDAVLRGGEAVRVLCDVRVAGEAGPGATMVFPSAGTSVWPVPSPLRAGAQTLPRTARLAAASCASIASADSSSFAVHGFQSGRVSGAYDGVGGTFVRAPVGPNGGFFPGEEVEVTLKSDLTGTTPVVARYRVAATGGSGGFAADTAYLVGFFPVAIAAGDLDRDGDLDLAVADEDEEDIWVFLNQGDGSFVADATYILGGPSSVALGDVDGDGDLDLVAFSSSDGNISVRLNQGGGTFGPATTHAVGEYPVSIALGDVNGDGDLDVVVANFDSNTVSTLLGQAGGSFGPQTTSGVVDEPGSVTLGDLDGDGDLDLAVANYGSNDVWVLLNQGDGSFGTHTTCPVGTGPYSIALGDVNGDGALDLAVANRESDNISVLLNQGDGSCAPQTTYGAGAWPESVALADVDGDGDLDLTAASNGSDKISVLLNQGNGRFGPPAMYVAGDEPKWLALGDLDRDGDLDVAVANGLSGDVSVLRNQ